MPSEPAPESSKAGIKTNADGTRLIPSSVRPDGTLRKEIKVRPGYRPPEDVEVYKNRTAEAWKNRGKGGVPGAETVDGDKSTGEGKGKDGPSKNAKRREARKRAAAEGKGEDGKKEAKEEEEEAVDPEVEKQKEAKKLAKKLRQARELKDKKEQGTALLPEQFEKVIRINELIRQLDSLGFDLEGERKVGGGKEVDGGKAVEGGKKGDGDGEP
jgi:partner of Y14 and mago